MRGYHLGKPETIAVSEPRKVAYDGKYIWLTKESDTRIYEWFANNTVDDGTPTELKFELKLKKTVEGMAVDKPHTDGVAICASINHMWVGVDAYKDSGNDPAKRVASKGTKFSKIAKIDMKSGKVVAEYPTPASTIFTGFSIVMNSNLHFCESWVFMVEDFVECAKLGVQKCWYLNVDTGVWGSFNLDTKPQKARFSITSCSTGIVYFAGYNSLSIMKYDVNTKAFIGSVKGNAFPFAIAGTPEQEVLVCSYGGMVSKLNASDTFTHQYSSDTEATAVVWQDPATYWTIDGAGDLFRIKTDNSIISTKYTGFDYFIAGSCNTPDEYPFTKTLNDEPAPNNWNKDAEALQGDTIDLSFNTLPKYDQIAQHLTDIMMIPSFTYQRWNGTALENVVVEPRLVIVGSSSFSVINTSDIKFGWPRPAIVRSSLEVAGKAMVSYGSQDYLGEKG